jgi:hypothetical protein
MVEVQAGPGQLAGRFAVVSQGSRSLLHILAVENRETRSTASTSGYV